MTGSLYNLSNCGFYRRRFWGHFLHFVPFRSIEVEEIGERHTIFRMSASGGGSRTTPTYNIPRELQVGWLLATLTFEFLHPLLSHFGVTALQTVVVTGIIRKWHAFRDLIFCCCAPFGLK